MVYSRFLHSSTAANGSQMKWHMHCVYVFYTIQMDANVLLAKDEEKKGSNNLTEGATLAWTANTHAHKRFSDWLRMVCVRHGRDRARAYKLCLLFLSVGG